jgi:C4-dicarboxylate transporter, DctQ subunit
VLRILAIAYDGLLTALAVISGALLGLIAFAVIIDVLMRNLGFQPPAHTAAVIEYIMFYVTLLASPWLLRQKGHVYIEVMVGQLAPPLRRICAVASYTICLATCLVLFYYGLDLTILSWHRGEYDIRSFDMPDWALYGCMPVAFLLMAIQFARFLLGYDSLYENSPPIH